MISSSSLRVLGICGAMLVVASCGSSSSSEDPDSLPPGPYELARIAGHIGGDGNADGVGADARFGHPHGAAIDGAGNVYVTDIERGTIRKIAPGGGVTTLAGKDLGSGTVDGSGATAQFNAPAGVAMDALGNVYVVENLGCTVRRVTPDGVVTTIAGIPASCGSADGAGSAAQFQSPDGIAVDAAGMIYVADTDNQTIRRIAPDGSVMTLAGASGVPDFVNAIGVAARFDSPNGLAVDAAGNLYVADRDNTAIRKIARDGAVTTLAGGVRGNGDGTGASAHFGGLGAIATDSAGNVYVADVGNHSVRKVSPTGVVTTLAGPAGAGVSGSIADLAPVGVVVDGHGTVYVTDDRGTVESISPDGAVTTVAGVIAMSGAADGTGDAALFSGPFDVVADAAGALYVADAGNGLIRKVTLDGVVTTLAGHPGGSSEDGIGTAAGFFAPEGLAIDGAGNLYVADTFNETVRKISPAGAVTTLAGSAGMTGTTDGLGAAARFSAPQGLAVDRAGNVYVADVFNQTIRKITPGGMVTTLAGSPGIAGNVDGRGAAAQFNSPSGIAIDTAGNLYVADAPTIRKITPDGVVSTLAGLAGSVGNVDGKGADARFEDPFHLTVDRAGNVYVTDAGTATLRKVAPDGTTTTIAGQTDMSGVRLGTSPRFALPTGIALVSSGLVVTDADAVLLLRPSAP